MGYVPLAVLGSLFFAFNNIFQRRAVIRVTDAAIGVLITVPMAAILYLIILVSLGQVSSIFSFSWQSYLWLAAAGIINYAIGRSLRYYLMQLSGANISNLLVSSSRPMFAVFFAITLLNEPLTWELAVGLSLIVSGLVINGLNPQIFKGEGRLFSGIPGKAYLLALGIGLAVGLAPILIKLGLGGSGSPVAGAFIAHSVATLSFIPLLFDHKKRVSLVTMKRGALGYFLLAGFFAAIAQLFRYSALGIGPASVVAPLFSISPIFALLLAFFFNRKLEVFNRNVILGTVVVIVGAITLA
ncbi:EamA family transporter [Chloroflexota bacterium]